MAFRPKFWPGLGLKDLASASKLWPRPQPQRFGLGLASISLSYYLIRHFSGKNRVKSRNFLLIFPAIINLKSYVVNHYLVFFHNYFWPQPWPQPPEIGLSLGLEVLASFNVTGCIILCLTAACEQWVTENIWQRRSQTDCWQADRGVLRVQPEPTTALQKHTFHQPLITAPLTSKQSSFGDKHSLQQHLGSGIV